ncbi:MAG: ATP-dependent helicase HrpB [Acetobacteraceae bacterium]|nr:ATP-dependent helicase HrpB [Acetobacteraceae bacterium]
MTEVLPVAASLPALHAALAAGGNAVLIAPPGAGKTTLVPLALLDAPWLAGGRIVMLEPRRLAARAAATRMAFLLGEKVGQRVGYRTRLDSAVSAATRIEVVTEGLLVRRLQSDPGLDGVGLVILDEVHERALDADLALAFCLDLQRGLRPELRLLAMSATADGARLGPLLGAEIIQSAGRQHPVSVSHAGRDLAQLRDLPEAMAKAIRAALAAHGGDVLAFLPGMGEIRRTEAALAGCGALVLALHGELPPAEQDLALRPAEGRRVVLATSIAETSLTVPGVRIVVDGGWRRAPQLDQATGLTRLATVRISRAAAEQRAGRAGREAPGVAVRLWTTALHRGLPAFDPPEMLRAELSGLALDCAAWGAAPADLPFPDPPPAGPLAAAQALLAELGALDGDGRITAEGRRMAVLGAHPRLAAMMLAAQTPGEAALAADIAALLEERDPLRARDAPADIGLRLAALAGHAEADRGAVARINRAAAQYRRRLRLGSQTAEGDPARLIAAGFPDRIAQRRGEPGSFRLSGGGGARLPVSDPLAKAPLLAVASLEMKAGARIRLAAPLALAQFPAALAARVTEAVESGLDPATGSVLARRRRRLGALILEDRTVPADPAATAAALAAAASLAQLPWNDAARQFQARVALMRRLEPQEGWPDLSDAALAADRAWLAAHLNGNSRIADLARLDMAAVLRATLAALPDGWQRGARLDAALPSHLSLPKGRAAVDYCQPVPLAAARAQLFYGLAETPKLAGGRAELRIALLSPAGRPVAITGDLAAFWRGAWADARRDMRGRYPRHAWPENPAEGAGA